MPLDHYVSQVHLRNFYSPGSNRLFAYRKSDLKRFPPRSEDVCRIEDGSTNAYLKEERIIEEFLLGVEPRYNAALAKLRDNRLDPECIHTIAGFAAYVTGCSPAGMRIQTGPLKANLEATALVLDRQGAFGAAPPALGGKSLTELLADKSVSFTVDEKYPQALGISSIIHNVSAWGNSRWEILKNDDPDTQFLTSDFPVAIEVRSDGIVNRLVPLAPDIAVRIIPDIRLSGAELDLSFSKFRHRHRTLSRSEAVTINRLIIQCAEDIVFSHDDRTWIERVVAKHRHCRIEAVTERVAQGSGYVILPRQRIVERRPAA